VLLKQTAQYYIFAFVNDNEWETLTLRKEVIGLKETQS
jgi:hypothetical protein